MLNKGPGGTGGKKESRIGVSSYLEVRWKGGMCMQGLRLVQQSRLKQNFLNGQILFGH